MKVNTMPEKPVYLKPIWVLAVVIILTLPGSMGQFLSTHAQATDFRPYREFWRLGDGRLRIWSQRQVIV